MLVPRASLPIAFALLALTTGATIAAPSSALATWYVDVNAPPGGNGSQGSPFQTIQEGIDAAAAAGFDTISVAPGVYVENIDYLNKRIAIVSEQGRDVTTIDGNQSGSAVRITGPIDWGNDVKLVGFTVTNGTGGSWSYFTNAGGGILIGDISPHIDDCTITGNDADHYGGGIFAYQSAALVTNTTIEFNDAPSYGFGGRGGGVYAPNFANSTIFENCEIRGNSCITYGGGAYGGSYFNCLIEGNTTSIGAGLYEATATNSTLRGNTAYSIDSSLDIGGGAAQATLVGCVIEDNHSFSGGGGAIDSTLTDCIVRRNTLSFNYYPLGSRGAGTEDCDLTNCVVYQNSATLGAAQGLPPSRGGGAYGGTATRTLFYENTANVGAGVNAIQLEHCVVFGNNGTGAVNATKIHNSVVTSNWISVEASSNVTYSNIEGGYPGTGNIDAPPLFWAPNGAPSGEGHDFYLKPGSPCIDAGDPNSPLDPDGSIADIGVFPFDATHCVEPTTYCTAKTNSLGCVPAIGSSGYPSLSSGALVVTASNVLNNKNGLLFWGSDSLASPFQGGIKCVAAPTKRTGIQNSGGNPPPNDCSGTYSFSFDPTYLQQQGFLAGQDVHAQYWSRDPQSPSTTGLTDALWFIICP